MINFTDWIATIPPEDKYIAYVGENETVSREFFLPDLTYKDYDFYLDLAFDLSTVTTTVQPRSVVTTQQSTTEVISADGTSVTATENTSQESYTQTGVTVDQEDKTDVVPLSKSVGADGIHLYWTVRAQHTQLPGLLRATLRAVGSVGKVKKSAMMVFYVAPSVAATPAVTIQMSEFEQMERAMVLSLQREADKILQAFSEQLGNAEDLKGYIDEKAAPATVHTYGTVKVIPQGVGDVYMNEEGRLRLEYATEDDIKAADEHAYNISRPIDPSTLVDYVGSKIAPAKKDGEAGTVKLTHPYSSGLEVSEDGSLKICVATEEQIDQRIFGYLPITPRTLDYAVKSVTYDKAEIDAKIGDIETALDSILAMQNALIGGDGV